MDKDTHVMNKAASGIAGRNLKGPAAKAPGWPQDVVTSLFIGLTQPHSKAPSPEAFATRAALSLILR